MKRNIKIHTNQGTIRFSIEHSPDSEKKLKKQIKSHIVYDLLFLSKKYKDKDTAFDFIELTSLEQYGITSIYDDKVFDFIKDVAFFSENEIKELKDIYITFNSLVIPMWYNHLLNQDLEWVDLQKRSRQLLKRWKIDYESIDLDEFIEEHDI